MTASSDKLDDLKKELSYLRQDFDNRINEIERRIRFFERQQQKKSVFESRSETLEPEASHDKVLQTEIETEEQPELFPAPVRQATLNTPDTKPDPALNGRETKHSILTGFAENTLPVFGPLAAFFAKGTDVYRTYRSQGKAPAFFMTIAGIVTLVMGFGYLLQYSFSQFLGPAGKVNFGFLAAVGIIITGVVIHMKKKDMDDYASSLIGLGVILCYLCAYFAASYYHLISEAVSFALLGVITGGAYFLALKFRTRVVSVVSLLGGAFAPLLMAGVDQSYYIYLTYLFILVCSALRLSRKISWQPLAHISLIITIAIVEYLLIDIRNPAFSPFGFILFIHLFFYIFVVYNCLDVLKTAGIHKQVIISFSSNLFFFLFALYQADSSTNLLGGYYFGNAVLFLSAFFAAPFLLKSGKTNHLDCLTQLQMIFALSAGVRAGFGILSIAGYAFLGPAWGLEALFLFYLGLRYKIIQVRMQAFAILFLALGFSFYHAASWIGSSVVPPPEIFQLSFGYGWMNLSLCAGLLWPAIFILEKHKAILMPIENKYVFISNEILSVFLSLLFLMTVAVFWAQGLWLACIVPMFFLIYRSKRKSLFFTEYLGLSHFLLLLVPILTSARIAGNFFFVEQGTIGKIARVEAFFCLYLVAEFYKRFNPKSMLAEYALILRVIFWCMIPVSFLPGIWHQHVYFFPSGIWLSAAICLAFFCRLKYDVLLLELKLLVIFACLGSVVACALVEFFGWKGHGFLALVSGLLFLGSALIGFKGLIKDNALPENKAFYINRLQFMFYVFFYYLGIFFFITIYGFTGAFSLASALTAVYFFLILLKSPWIEPLKQHIKPLYLIVCACCVLTGIDFLFHSLNGFSAISGLSGFLFKNGIFNIVAILIVGLCVHLNYSHFNEARNRLGGELNHFRLFHLLTGLVYTAILSRWFDTGYGPALSVAFVMHATIVLFLTLKPRYQKLINLAVLIYMLAAGKIIFWDMGDFSIIQKVIAFIVIGILLLGGAYQYQKRRSVIVRDKNSDGDRFNPEVA